MKPRTKLHREVVELASDLWSISKAQKEWAYKECLEHRAYATKTRVLCLDCGESFSPTLVSRKKAICPHCNTKVEVKESRCTTDKQTNYFAITEIVNEFQVVRNYELIAYYKKGNPAKYYLHEILQQWILPNLKTTLFGLSHATQSFCDSWGGNMEIREENNRSYYGKKYDIYARKYHPDSEIKPEYLKYGINHNLSGLSFIEAITFIPRNPKLETLLKAKQYSLLSKGESWQINSFWNTIKICLRNKYKVSDVSIYFDYLELLKYFKKDLRNAQYVCPKNLKLQHDKLTKKKRAILRLEEQERERRRVIEHQQKLEQSIVEYVERMQKFFVLEFKKGNIHISVLKSIDEFKEEGDTLKHCVFTNEYYLKQDSLIFSAKVDGKRTETIEVKIDKMKIEQSRGEKNNPSEYNKEIVQLMKSSLPKIRAVLKKENQQKQFLKQTA